MCQNSYLHVVLMVTIVASCGITISHGQFFTNSHGQFVHHIGLSRSDPCRPSPCGPNTSCHIHPSVIGAQCRCLDGFVPDQNTIIGCKPQCTRDNECPNDQHCRSNKCVRVCQAGACGTNADCVARNHRAICECPSGYQGQPQFRCTRRPNTPRPFEISTRVNNLVQPDPECIYDSECPSRMACSNNKCVNPCVNACGEGAHCEVVQGRARCSCPQFYKGNPYTRCYPECTRHNECPSYQACNELQCVDPCARSFGACGVGAECRVQNNKPICSCPPGYSGHPFERCVLTPEAFPPSGCEGHLPCTYRSLSRKLNY